MHRLSLILITLLSASQAQEYTLETINVEATSDVFSQTQEDALNINAFTLQERLKNNVSFDTVKGEKNGEGLSFRGLDDRATGYFEDGIPLYRGTNGETATMFYAPKGTVTIDNTSANNIGVSSMGADVQINTAVPTQSLEAMLLGNISNNDRRAQGYIGSRTGNKYVQLNASTYHMGSYALSDDYIATPAQPKGERRYSDRTQNDASLKAGFYPDSHTHLAAKISTTRSHFGVSPNAHTDITKNAGDDSWSANKVPWDAYTAVPKKSLDSLYLYGDFTHGDIETTVRAYYDRYTDFFAFYTDNNYTTYQQGIDIWSDSRLGTSFKTALKSDTHTDAIAITLQRETHRWISDYGESAHYTNDFLETSYLADYTLPDHFRLDGAVSYRLLQPSQEFDTRNTSKNYDTKKMLDYQLKLTKNLKSSSLYLAVAHKSRFPSMADMYPLLPFQNVYPGLKPEQSQNIEAGYENRSLQRTLLTLDAYHYDITDLIVQSNSISYNRANAKHYGVEGHVKSDLFENNHLDAGYRYAHTNDSAGKRIQLIPSHRLTLQDTLDISPGFTVTAQYLYTGARYSNYLNVMHKLQNYNTLDLYLNYVRPQGMSYRLGIKNLTDEAYEWQYGYPTAGRSVFATLQWDL
ncbi:MAG: TonB-dependent receptor [Sulfuricurvum sp.]|nr:TonB-dependent receptor [Sulfuricurvum sp.]MDP3023129.1 TonB-dependent receptor [Sulfuricurvum sp.]MDP3120440.1 TonB-dependent receptor [Sulfuricurvum sp.]